MTDEVYLKFYDSSYTLIEDTDYLITAHNGTLGESVDVLVYLKNSAPSLYYTNLSVWVEDTEAPDDTLGVYGTGWGIKLSSGERQPTDYEWNNVLAGDAISLPDVGTTDRADTTNYYPFWMRVTVPGNLPAQNKTTMRLRETMGDWGREAITPPPADHPGDHRETTGRPRETDAGRP